MVVGLGSRPLESAGWLRAALLGWGLQLSHGRAWPSCHPPRVVSEGLGLSPRLLSQGFCSWMSATLRTGDLSLEHRSPLQGDLKEDAIWFTHESCCVVSRGILSSSSPSVYSQFLLKTQPLPGFPHHDSCQRQRFSFPDSNTWKDLWSFPLENFRVRRALMCPALQYFSVHRRFLRSTLASFLLLPLLRKNFPELFILMAVLYRVCYLENLD